MKVTLAVQKPKTPKMISGMTVNDNGITSTQIEGDLSVTINLNGTTPKMTVNVLQGLSSTNMVYDKELDKSRYETITSWITEDLAIIEDEGEDHNLTGIEDIQLPIKQVIAKD